MNEDLPTNKELEVLIAIIRYMQANQNNLPDNSWLANRLTVVPSRLSEK